MREAANRTRCQNNLKQLGLAAHAYHGAQNTLPPGVQLGGSQAPALVLLLPYLEQDARFQAFDPTKPVFDDANHNARLTGDVPGYLCPSDPSTVVVSEDALPTNPTTGPKGRTNYHANLGTHSWLFDTSGTTLTKPANMTGAFAKNSRVQLTDIADGTSGTAMFAEVRRVTASPSTVSDRFSVTKLSPSPMQWPTTPPANLVSQSTKNIDPTTDPTFTGLCDAAASFDSYTACCTTAGTPTRRSTRTPSRRTTPAATA